MKLSKIASSTSALLDVLLLAGFCAIVPNSLRAAERETRTTSALTLEGRCQTLVVNGEDRSSACAPQVINMSYDNGRTGFYFGTRDGTIVVFSSDGNEQKKLNADTVSTPVDKMLVTHEGVVKQYPVRGACVFGNPNVRPVTISCTATGSAKSSSGKFISNLKAPKVESFGGGL